MALIHADGFDHWGTFANMILAGWSGNGTVTTIHPRTGTYSCRTDQTFGPGIGSQMVYNFGGVRTVVGCGIALFMTDMPSTNNTIGIQFQTAAFAAAMTMTISAAGEVLIRSGNQVGTILGTSATGVIVAGSFCYIEIKSTAHATLGTVEVRVNGQSVLTIINGNTGGSYGAIAFGKQGTNNDSPGMWWDDLVIWDTTGARCNDFLGDRRCFTSFPTADTAEADWAPSTGVNGYACIDEVPPSDVDYVEAATAGDISEYDKTTVTIDTNDVAAAVVFARAAKTDAGVSTFRLGLHSASFVTNSDEIFPGTGYTFYERIFELDPNGNVPWTKTAIDDAFVRITREQ
jgi:hypothetical protein